MLPAAAAALLRDKRPACYVVTPRHEAHAPPLFCRLCYAAIAVAYGVTRRRASMRRFLI